MDDFTSRLYRTKWVNRCLSIQPLRRSLSVVGPTGDKFFGAAK
jgi:hypothetical protein